MIFSLNIQVLTCLMVYVSCVHSIKVTFGTKNGPIEPPTPEPLPSPQPYRAPAPVWEERSDDAPDPNAQWRPQLFVPQPRYTQIIFAAPTPQSINNAQRFVNSYKPVQPVHQPIQAPPVRQYFTPSQLLSAQSLPGVGLRYFVPAYLEKQIKKQDKKQEDAKHNDIETNEISEPSKDSSSDALWKYEKDSKRNSRNTLEGTGRPNYEYVWPEFVQRSYRH